MFGSALKFTWGWALLLFWGIFISIIAYLLSILGSNKKCFFYVIEGMLDKLWYLVKGDTPWSTSKFLYKFPVIWENPPLLIHYYLLSFI